MNKILYRIALELLNNGAKVTVADINGLLQIYVVLDSMNLIEIV